MGMSACIFAFGPYSPDLAQFLDYPSEKYRQTRRGTLVVVELFQMPGSSTSTQFAALLGVSDPWDFNQHELDPGRIDVAGLRTFLKTLECPDDELRELERLIKLRDHGFRMVFLPQG